MKKLSPELRARFRSVRLLAMDVDGVLTDGGVYVLEDGREFRRFNIKDGLGIKMVLEKGIYVAVISSSTCPSVLHRMQRLGVSEVHLGVNDKLRTLQTICESRSVELSQVCYIGDDLADLEVMQAVGLPCAPADAVESVRKIAAYVADSIGGIGVVRELSDWLHLFSTILD